MNILKRTLAMMLVLCMLFGMVPFAAFASENTDPTGEATESVADVSEGENHQPGEMARFGGKHGKDEHSKDERPEDETTVSTEAPVVETTVATEPVVETTTATEPVVETTAATEPVVESTAATEPVVETTEATEATEAATETTEATEAATEPTADPYGIMTLELDDELAVASVELGTKPDDGTVTDEPFDTTVSANYRIPGLVNHNGTLIASADARWNYEYDGGGMDLVVSRSTDGITWNYTFAGYLGDNGNVWDADSTTLMDPVIISDGSTLYLLADMYPAGYSISSSSTTNTFSDTAIGFDANGNLLLSKDGRSSYGYYLKDGKIYATDGTEQSGYTVQGWYDLYQDGTYVTNLFFSDSPFQVRATSYICLTTSTDGGKTWNSPILVNAKPSGVSWMVLGPGSGLVTQDGNLAFTAYDGSNIYLIYGKDGNWNRVQTSAAANESSIIELNDGTIRAFVKRTGNNTIAYVDFTKSGSGYTAGGLVDTGVTNFSTCMVSSLHYSKTLDGKKVVLVCCPSKSGAGDWNGRFNGKIHMFTLDSSNAMTLVGSYALNGESDFFAYSNMAEKNDGTIAVLYEDDCISYAAGNHYGEASHITYTSVNLETAFGVTFDKESKTVTDETTAVTVTAPDLSKVEIEKLSESTPAEGYNRSMTYSIKLYDSTGALYSGSATVKVPAGDLVGCSKYIGSVDDTSFAVDAPVDGYFTLNVPHFSEVNVSGFAMDPDTVDVTLYAGKSKTFTIADGAYSEADVSTAPAAAVATLNKIASKTTEADTKLQAVTEIVSGKQYLLVNNRANKTLTNTTNSPGLLLDGAATVDSTHLWTITASSDGNHTVRYGTNGGYLNVGYGSASVTWSEVTLRLDYIEESGHWLINDNAGWYGLNDYTGAKTIAAGWTDADTDTGSWWTIYEVVTTEESATTEVTFTGVAAGNTTATIGHVTYNITVVDAPVEGDIADFNNIVGEGTYEDENTNSTYKSVLDMTGKVIQKLTISAGASFNLNVDITDYDSIEWSVADPSVATVDANGVVTAVATGETTVTATVVKDGKTESISIPVVVKPSQVESSTVNVPIFFYIDQVDHTTPYYTMFLSTGDDGVLEEHYTMVPVTEGEVIWIERPKNSALGWVWTATPDADHALVYMASTGSVSQYYPLKDTSGALGESDSNSTTAQNPGDYYKNSISYKNVVSVGEDAGEDNWGTALNSHLTTAINDTYKCDGAMSNTRWDHDGVPSMVSSMTFISDPLPKIEKMVDGVLPTTRKQADYRKYTDGMVASVGELVYFKITVTLDRPSVWVKDDDGNNTTTGAIDYSNAIVSDTVLNGAYLYTKELDQQDGNYDGEIAEESRAQTINITDQLNAAWGSDEQTRTITLYLVYQIQTEDIPKFIIDNVANLNTNYQSEYSTGVSARKADATASITVVGRAMDNIVIDFGQKVQITGLTDDYLKGVYTGENVKYSAKYGTVEITKQTDANNVNTYTVTYIPTSILQGTDAVWLYGLGLDENNNQVEKIINGFIVYPATTVYYEEGFLFTDNSTGWNLVDNSKNETMVQEFEPLGKSNYDNKGTLISKTSGKVHEYGYDDIYDSSNAGSGSSYAESSTAGAGTSFTFTGTGFDLYANSSADTGVVAVYSKGKLSKLYSINTKLSGSETESDITNDQQDAADAKATYYSLPIISETALPYGTYTVQLKATSNDGAVCIDGVRIYNTIEDSSIFNIDEEDNPVFYELRDYVLNAIGVEALNESAYIDPTEEAKGERDYDAMVDEVSEMAGQVYTALGDGTKAVVINKDEDGTTFTDDQAQDLLDNGPKNELYLYPGQTLVFSVTTDRVMQLGLKAPTGSAKFTLTVNGTKVDIDGTKGTDGSAGETEILNTTVDMFYKIAAKGGATHTVNITVSEGSGVLSVTKLKICDDPNFSFTALTQDDIEATLMSIYGLDAEEENPTEPEAPTYTMVELKGTDVVIDGTVFDYTGEAIEPAVTVNVDGTQLVAGRDYSVTYTNNVEPGTATVTVRGIATASETLGYTGEVSIDFTINAPVVPDETEAPTEPSAPVVEEKEATLQITYINLFGRKVGSAALTKTGIADQRCIFSASEISANAPASRRAMWFLPIVTTYGNTVSIVVPVI